MRETILEALVSSSIILNGDDLEITTGKAKIKLAQAVMLIQKGYSIEDDMNAIMKWYRDISQVPYAKVHSAVNLSHEEVLSSAYKSVNGIIPNNFAITIVMQELEKSNVNYITNVEKEDLKKALITLSETI